MALDDATKTEILALLKEAGGTGMTKEEVLAMVNGVATKTSKDFKKVQTTLDEVSNFTKAFGGMKPKKLAKALAKLGKGKSANSGDGDENDGDENENEQPAAKNKNSQQLVDVVTPKKLKKLNKRIQEIELERDQSKAETAKERKHGSIRSLLSNFTWAKDTGRESVFRDYADRVERDKDGKLVIKLDDGDYAEFNKEFVEQDVTERFDYALKKPESSGSGITKASDRKAGSISLDDDLSTPEKQAEYAKSLSKLLPAA